MSLSSVWHPFAQHALQKDFPAVVSATGCYIETIDGRRIIDAISSWWVTTHGHSHPHIVAAIQSQAERLDQVIFAEYTHAAAEQVAARLVQLAPGGLEHVFFSDSGSTSVEVALKMALGYWHHLGGQRHRVVVMDGSYHGDTIGCMSVGARGVFTQSYEPLLFEVDSIPFPAEDRAQATFDALERSCRRGDIAAFIVEPLILGAGGMLMYPPGVLKELHRICRAHGVLFIADEVMTGWGRTGTMFACEQARIDPDIACYSKGLTGGSLPLAATMCTRAIFDAHYSEDRRRTFFHSSSFTANPIACAAAVANLEIWETEPVRERIERVGTMQRQRLKALSRLTNVCNLRQTGTITALDVSVPDQGYLAQIGPRMAAGFRAANVLVRPLGNTIYVLPPYCVTAGDLDLVYAAIEDVVTRLA